MRKNINLKKEDYKKYSPLRKNIYAQEEEEEEEYKKQIQKLDYKKESEKNLSKSKCKTKNLNLDNDNFVMGWDPTSLGFGSINYEMKRPII